MLATLAFLVAALPAPCVAMQVVPENAEIVRTHGLDFAVFPKRPLPRPFTGCQFTWLGDADDKASMELLSVTYYKKHRVQWFYVKEPDEEAMICVYRDGAVLEAQSSKPGKCPSAAKIEEQ